MAGGEQCTYGFEWLSPPPVAKDPLRGLNSELLNQNLEVRKTLGWELKYLQELLKVQLLLMKHLRLQGWMCIAVLPPQHVGTQSETQRVLGYRCIEAVVPTWCWGLNNLQKSNSTHAESTSKHTFSLFPLLPSAWAWIGTSILSNMKTLNNTF